MALLAFLGALGGCSPAPGDWEAMVVPVVVAERQAGPWKPSRRDCPPIDPAWRVEAASSTAVAGVTERADAPAALAADLVVSEARKNAAMRKMIAAHERCRSAVQ